MIDVINIAALDREAVGFFREVLGSTGSLLSCTFSTSTIRIMSVRGEVRDIERRGVRTSAGLDW